MKKGSNSSANPRKKVFSWLSKIRKHKGHPDSVSPTPTSASASAVAIVELAVPAAQDHEDAITKEEKLPRTVAVANTYLNEAVEKLKQKIPQDILASSTFEIKPSADINSLANNIGSALVTMMEQRNIEKAKQSNVKMMITEWAKKTIPFVEKGLTIANNLIPAPYNLIAAGILYIVQKAREIGDMADKVDDMIMDISLEIQNVGVIGEFSNIHRDEVRIAAIYLSTAVMDCLTSLIDWMARFPFITSSSDFDQKLATIRVRSQLYMSALQTQVFREKQHEDIINWISPEGRNFIPLKRRDEVADTHQSFVTSEEYLKWVGDGSSVLICSGLPGVGKSHLVSLIFHRLREDPNLGISCFFFNHSNLNETADTVIRGWLKQVVTKLDKIPEAISAEYVRFKNDPQKIMPNQQTFTRLLKSALEQFFSPSFFLLDGFDEFRNMTDQERERGDLCAALSAICETGSAKILITTRPQHRDELKNVFSKPQSATIKGDLRDVRKYLEYKLKPLRLNEELKGDIRNTILNKNQDEAWFLLVQLQVQYVLEPKDAREILNRLNSLPTSPMKAYRGILERMEPDHRQFAYKILSWVIYAQRILRMPEIKIALAIEIRVPSLDPRAITPGEEIISTCGGFLNYDIDTDLVTFSHETARQFLEEHESSSLCSHVVLSRTCLAYLRLPEIAELCRNTRYPEYAEQPEIFQFSDYAAHFWASHAVLTERDAELEAAILETFGSVGRRETIEQLKEKKFSFLFGFRCSTGKSLLHGLVENRLSIIFMSPLLESQLTACASFYNQKLIQSLLEVNGSINEPDHLDRTPLHYAARNGELQVVQWLTERHADVNGSRRTVLHFAAQSGKLEVFTWLVENGADIKAVDDWGRTVLHSAAQSGKSEVFTWLVKNGANIKAADENGCTVLHSAATCGKLEVVTWLIENGADVNVADKNGCTALLSTAKYGEWEVVTWLIEKGADFKVMDRNGWTVLHFAAKYGKWEVVTWLIENGADIKAADKDGRTVLHFAVLFGKWEVVPWLVEHGADVKSANERGWTVLHCAAHSGKLEVVTWLVENGVDIKVADKQGWTALDLAEHSGPSRDAAGRRNVADLLKRALEKRRSRMGNANNDR